MTTKRQPKQGETWTIQTCMVHGVPKPATHDWTKEPVSLGVTITTIDPKHAALVECGCMEFGDVPARLHKKPEPPKPAQTPAPAPEKPKA